MIRHCREFYEIGAERDRATAATLTAEGRDASFYLTRAAGFQAELDKLDGRTRRKERRERVASGEIEPVESALWLDVWLERAKTWLAVHACGYINRPGKFRVRLLAGAPLDELASETRIRITHRHTEAENHNEITFPNKAALQRAIDFIQDRDRDRSDDSK
jgi:hypothetical protein